MRIPLFLSSRDALWRKMVIAVAIVILSIAAFRAIHKSNDGDFKLHWESGHRFLAGEYLYESGHNLPYPPFWAMAHAPAALLPLPIAKAVLFPFGVGALVWLLWVLQKLAEPTFQLNRTQKFWTMAAALVLSARFVLRDLAEVGVNTALVALTWFAIYLWRQRRDLSAGLSLGLAVALKCTPAIFIAYFFWKRQWRVSLFATAAAALFTLAPILYQGPDSWRNHMTVWSARALTDVTNQDPSIGVLGPEPLQNMSLRPALARYFIHLPEDHPGRVKHPLYFDVLNFPPFLANQIINIIQLFLVGTFLWWSRRAVVTQDESRLLWELAAVSILMLLLSPITWGQHCVALLPPCYFVSALCISRGGLPRWANGLLAFYIIAVLLLSRDLLGRDASFLLGSYHVVTMALLALLGFVLAAPRLESRNP